MIFCFLLCLLDREHFSEQLPPTEGNDRRSFYDLDFNALDRGLSPEQRQEWNSIYASYRGRSVLTGSIAGVDPHTVRVRDRRTGEMVRKTMYCATVILFRVRILIPSTEMWMQGEERPDIDLTQREMRYTAIPDLREQYRRGEGSGLHREEL